MLSRFVAPAKSSLPPSARRASGVSWDRMPGSVKVIDVSPRDGLQNEKLLVPTATKLELISRLRESGVRSIEATSFVSPKAVPQMADAAQVMAGVQKGTGISFAALVPNMKGYEAALKAGAEEVTVLAAASETMCQKNTRCSLDESVERGLTVLRASKAAGIRTRASIGVCFVCPFDGDVSETVVASIVQRFYEEGCYEIGLCDTIGKATPLKVRKVLHAIQAAGVPMEALALHLHDTYGQATANMLVGLQEGVAAYDTSVGGIGGCPFAPGATGNVSSEDLVYMLDGLGIETGIDIHKLSDTGDWINGVLGRPHSSRAGTALMGAANRAKLTTAQTLKPKVGAEKGRTGPLAGYRVIELGNFLAGPFCGTTLAYFGADVIKIETPGAGDPIRRWRAIAEDGTAPWARSLLRNKRSFTVNLKHPDGKAAVRELIESADAVCENFRPGVMEKFGLCPEAFKESNPGLVYCRVSGYGQDGPYKSRPGFASATEGEGGFRYINGFADRPPVRPNMSIGDSLAGVQAALGVTMALLHRTKTGKGQVVDMALYEAVYNMMEGVIPEFSALGLIRQPSGSTISGIVPTITANCSDGKAVVIGANGDAIFPRVMKVMGREDMAADERYKDNAGRVVHKDYIEKVMEDWCSARTAEQVLAGMAEAQCPAGPIYNAEDMMNDPHFKARGMFEEITTPTGLTFNIPAMVPKLSETPGNTEFCGQEVGAHNTQIMRDYLDYDEEKIKRMREDKAVGSECE